MSRSGYIDDIGDQWAYIMYRGAVASATKGARGQALLRDLLAALNAMSERKLIAHELVEKDGAVCALGALGKARNLDMSELDPEDIELVAAKFGIADSLAREIVFMNDECYYGQTPAQRFIRMREWVAGQIKAPNPTKNQLHVGRE